MSVSPEINPFSIRTIFAQPNHVRCWKKSFYHKIDGHNVSFGVLDDMEILNAAKAAYHLAMHHKIDVVMNFRGVKLNVTCQNGAKPENIVRKYYKACRVR